MWFENGEATPFKEGDKVFVSLPCPLMDELHGLKSRFAQLEGNIQLPSTNFAMIFLERSGKMLSMSGLVARFGFDIPEDYSQDQMVEYVNHFIIMMASAAGLTAELILPHEFDELAFTLKAPPPPERSM